MNRKYRKCLRRTDLPNAHKKYLLLGISSIDVDVELFIGLIRLSFRLEEHNIFTEL